mmetsp:Transcript_25936/g.59170  ORF Transcript_25936/g.59170 Transcript_25936/m.59170 type:complete len:260 (-) Transcript_25936:165-944(-)
MCGEEPGMRAPWMGEEGAPPGMPPIDGRHEFVPSGSRNGDWDDGYDRSYSRQERPLSANAGSGSVNRFGSGGRPGGPQWRPPGAIDSLTGGRSSLSGHPTQQRGPAYPAGVGGGLDNRVRELAFLARAAQDGAVTDATPLRIIVEFCNSEHYSRRHDTARYQDLFQRVALCVQEQLRGRRVEILPNTTSSQIPPVDPRPGAFEVYVDWDDSMGRTHTVVLFSKLETMRYPKPEQVAARLRALLSGNEDASGFMGDDMLP